MILVPAKGRPAASGLRSNDVGRRRRENSPTHSNSDMTAVVCAFVLGATWLGLRDNALVTVNNIAAATVLVSVTFSFILFLVGFHFRLVFIFIHFQLSLASDRRHRVLVEGGTYDVVKER